MKKLLQLVIAGLVAATLGLPVRADDNAPKPKPKAKAKAKAKPKAKAKADATKAETKPDPATTAIQADRKDDTSDRLNVRLRRVEDDQKDRAHGTGASAGATSSTPSAPSAPTR